MNLELFADAAVPPRPPQVLAPGALLLPGFALAHANALIAGVARVSARAPFRNMSTRGGYRMSVAITNCGEAGWVSDASGYRYDRIDPETGLAWPAMPDVFRELAIDAAALAGFAGFTPDACLMNSYEPGARLSLHQDRNERNFESPVVSVSLGLPAVFLFGGAARSVRPSRVPLAHGDVVVWGADARLYFHGVLPLKDGNHALLGQRRINLTFRSAL